LHIFAAGMEGRRKNITRIKRGLDEYFDRILPILKKLHPSDIADVLEEVSPESRQRIINVLPVRKVSEALTEMDDELDAATLLKKMTNEQAARVIEELHPDDAADLLANLPENDLQRIFKRLPPEDEAVIRKLMSYEDDSAGGIMNPELFKLNGITTKHLALQEILHISEEIEDFYVIYVIDNDNKLLGAVSLNNLLRASASAKLSELMDTGVISVSVDADQEEAARLMRQYDLPTIPVVDGDNHLLGRILFDDVMDVIHDESTEDLLKIHGVSEDEELRGTWFEAVKSRIPWLLINVFTASAAGFVVLQFRNIIESLAVIAGFMPVIAGVAGNGATQALAVTIRRIATDGVERTEVWKIILKEISVGVFNGIVVGILVTMTALFLQNESGMENSQPFLLGLVVFMAMVGNLFVAGFAGSAIPLLLQRLGADPAVASSILITGITDILGYLMLFGFGTALLL